MLNGRLLTYLKRPDTVQKLLDYLIGQPPGAASTAPQADGGDGEGEDGRAPCVRDKAVRHSLRGESWRGRSGAQQPWTCTEL